MHQNDAFIMGENLYTTPYFDEGRITLMIVGDDKEGKSIDLNREQAERVKLALDTFLHFSK